MRMGDFIQSYATSLLPPDLRMRKEDLTELASKKSYLVSLILLAALFFFFLASYAFLSHRFDPEARSLRLPAIVGLGLPMWGLLSFVFYYAFHWTRYMYYFLPGILIGGGLFLGLISFGFEEAFPGIIAQANVAVFMTLFTTYLFAVSDFYKKHPRIEHFLIILGSSIMYAMYLAVGFYFQHSFTPFLPKWVLSFFDFNTTTILVSLGCIVLVSTVSVFHFNSLKEASKKARTLTDHIHIGLTTVFVVFGLYICFLFLFGAGRSRGKK